MPAERRNRASSLPASLSSSVLARSLIARGCSVANRSRDRRTRRGRASTSLPSVPTLMIFSPRWSNRSLRPPSFLTASASSTWRESASIGFRISSRSASSCFSGRSESPPRDNPRNSMASNWSLIRPNSLFSSPSASDVSRCRSVVVSIPSKMSSAIWRPWRAESANPSASTRGFSVDVSAAALCAAVFIAWISARASLLSTSKWIVQWSASNSVLAIASWVNAAYTAASATSIFATTDDQNSASRACFAADAFAVASVPSTPTSTLSLDDPNPASTASRAANPVPTASTGLNSTSTRSLEDPNPASTASRAAAPSAVASTRFTSTSADSCPLPNPVSTASRAAAPSAVASATSPLTSTLSVPGPNAVSRASRASSPAMAASPKSTSTSAERFPVPKPSSNALRAARPASAASATSISMSAERFPVPKPSSNALRAALPVSAASATLTSAVRSFFPKPRPRIWRARLPVSCASLILTATLASSLPDPKPSFTAAAASSPTRFASDTSNLMSTSRLIGSVSASCLNAESRCPNVLSVFLASWSLSSISRRSDCWSCSAAFRIFAWARLMSSSSESRLSRASEYASANRGPDINGKVSGSHPHPPS